MLTGAPGTGGAYAGVCGSETVEGYCFVHACPLSYPDDVCNTGMTASVTAKAWCSSAEETSYDLIEVYALDLELWYDHDDGTLAFISENHSSTVLAGCRPGGSLICSGVGVSCP